MSRLPQMSAQQLIKVLYKIDSTIEARKGKDGSHVVQLKRVVKDTPLFTTIASHGNRPLKEGTLKGILEDLQIDEKILRDRRY